MPALSAADGTAVGLRFSGAPGVTDLVFGGEQGGETLPLDAMLVITLPALAFVETAIPAAPVALMIALLAFSVAVEGRYDSRAARPTVGRAERVWHQGAEHTLSVISRRQATVHDRTGLPTFW